jgi:tetratricopeptide (TPR) repeat protein
LLARVYEQLDQPTEALAALRRVIARQPYDVASAERVIALLWQQGRVEEVIAEYQRLVRVAPHEARFAAELCQLLFQAGRRGEALTMLAKLGRDNPRDVRLHETIVDLYARFHEAEAAHRELQLLAKLEPSDPERFVTLGEAELARGRKDAARAAFARVSQGRHTLTAHMRLAQIYLDHEFPNEALAEYDQAQKLRPNDAHVARGRAEVLARLFRYKDAVSEWQRALSLAATDQQLRHDARKELVGLWDELAELKGHVMELEQLCGSSTASSPAPQAPACESEQARTLVEAYERMARHGGARAEPARQLRAAEDMLTRIVRAEPRDLESLLALERLRVKRGDLDGAIAVLEQLTHADPDNERLYLERMVGYALSRYRDDDAARYAQRAVASAPDDPVAHEHLGDLYRARNDLSRALTSYERALALDPTRFGLAWRIAQHEIAIGDAAAAELRLRSVVRGSQDDDLVLRALRSALQLGLSETHLVELEREVLPLALLEPPRAVYRRALLELYAVLVPRLAQRTAGAEPDAGLARSELSAIGRRAAKPLLAALADPDVSQARESIALLAVVGNPSAAQALVALAERGADLELRRDALRVAAVLGGDELAPHLVALARVKEARLQAVAVWGLARGQSQATRRRCYAVMLCSVWRAERRPRPTVCCTRR